MNKTIHNIKSGNIKKCQVCGNDKLMKIIDLGNQPPCDSILDKKNLEIEKFKYSRKKVGDILQEEIEGKVFFEDIEVDIKIKKNIESKNNHTIEIFGEIRDIIINYYAPFTPLDKNMRIEKNGVVEKIIREDSISPV